MQKITYINLYGETIVFGRETPIIFASVTGMSRSSGKLITSQGAYQSGQTIYRAQLAARKVTVTFNIYGVADREEMYKQRERIERVLAYHRCVKDGKCGTLIYENDAGAWMIDAVPSSSVTYGKRFLNCLPNCKVSFTASGAYLRSQQSKKAKLRMGAGGFILPTALPITLGTRLFEGELRNEGTADSPVEIVIHGTGEAPMLVNHTTGAQIVVNHAIETGARLVINTDPDALSCVIYHADGTQEDAFGYLDAQTAISAFLLQPGANNVEYIPSVPSTGSLVEITWHSMYEGV